VRRARRTSSRIQRGLGVERVEDGLDHEGVGAAVDQALDGFAVGVAQLVEAGVAEARIVDVGLIEAVRLVGPITPITKRGLPGVVAATASQQARATARRPCSARTPGVRGGSRPG
jgi:hypothetical protein